MFKPLQTKISLLMLLQSALGYIPALPTNSTRYAIASGLNVTDISKLTLQWYSNGSYQEHVSYQLVGSGSTGFSKGVLVHFSEENVISTTPPGLSVFYIYLLKLTVYRPTLASTPWIALVSCDKNATDASVNEDIFTLARDKGAVSALLYSLYSAACVINEEYSNPATFDQVFDIFSTQSLTSARLIEYQFGQLGPQDNSICNYDSRQLNNSATDIITSIQLGYPISGGYLLAAMRAYNATDLDTGTDPPIKSGSSTTPRTNGGSSKTALAMIVLYAITGCVSALFCLVIISGAIRAFRHPDRYGPRAFAENGGPPQSRARGLTRAILDTFPVVKFSDSENPYPREKDLETQAQDPQPHRGQPDPNSKFPISDSWSTEVSARDQDAPPRVAQGALCGSTSGDTGSLPCTSRVHRPALEGHKSDVIPSSFGRETCPICIVDFEKGDALRVLPCEGRHRFHQECVDPWLLRLSSSCPICRHDFLALETILSGQSEAPVTHTEGEFEDVVKAESVSVMIVGRCKVAQHPSIYLQMEPPTWDPNS
ncbi:hypothetical protein CVT24_009412 [Panaeolus cyanescens]|uniref:RING-type domain-containing protein n=1 Tax=Panaeolus cyanescens TaxID=181874 RepID=A0A409VAQ1_9AGAR|nr:hypothetical protein CVT24_009412 [Panaeolus cyanescens]